MSDNPEVRGLGIRIALIAVLGAVAAYTAFPVRDKITLGLDLQGGTHLVLEVDLDEAVRSHGERTAAGIATGLEEAGVSFGRTYQESLGQRDSKVSTFLDDYWSQGLDGGERDGLGPGAAEGTPG